MSSRSEITNRDGAAADSTDGPLPMRDYKPAKMNPNSADQFWQAHQAEYEARGARPGDPVERVRRHNAAYPLLRDELDRRRSLTKITPGKAIKLANGRMACTCDACLKIKKKSLKKSRGKSRRTGSRHGENIIKYQTRNNINVCVKRKFCSRCKISSKEKENLNQNVYDKDFQTDSRYSKNFKNRSSSNDKRARSAKAGHLLRTDRSNNALEDTPIKKTRNKYKEQNVSSKPETIKVTRKFHNKTNIKDDSSSRKRPRIENADNGNDSDDADSSASNKEFISKDGSRAHSVATEPSVPSYNSSFSLGLENEPMVSGS